MTLRFSPAAAALVLVFSGPAPAAAQQPDHTHQLVEDPVCGMDVESAHAAFKTTYQDKTYYFCAAACQKAFEKEPAKYLARPAKEPTSALKARHEAAPGDIALALAYGDRLLKDGDVAVAKTLFEKIRPRSMTRTQQADVLFQLGTVAMKEKRYDDALAFWKTVRSDFRDTERLSHATVNSAAILYQLKGELAPAHELLSEAFRVGVILDQHAATASKLMLMMSYDKGDFAAARAWLEKADPAVREDGHISDSLWVVYLKTGDTERADRMLSDYTAKVKDDYFALYRLAAIAAEAKVKTAEALTWIERSNELSGGEKFYVLDTRSLLRWQSGEKDKAIADLEKALALCRRQDARQQMQARLLEWRRSLGK
jgi:YHS domain-containing protein